MDRSTEESLDLNEWVDDAFTRHIHGARERERESSVV